MILEKKLKIKEKNGYYIFILTRGRSRRNNNNKIFGRTYTENQFRYGTS